LGHGHERQHRQRQPVGVRRELDALAAASADEIDAVVDAFDAMTFDRPYSKAISVESAKAEIRRRILDGEIALVRAD
jgi:hypothetical protein